MKIMFVCHGNICRSPTAEFIFRRMCDEEGVGDVDVSSSATSDEEIIGGIGNPVYPPARIELQKHGIDCSGKRAARLKKEDCDKYDLFIAMDNYNIRNILRIFGSDAENKVRLLLDYDGGGEVYDPWYTGDFKQAYCDIERGCNALLREIVNRI